MLRTDNKSNDDDNILQVGTRIVSQWQRPGGTEYPGKIVAVNADGTYDVQYDDGDHDERVPTSRISSINKTKHHEQRARRLDERPRGQQMNNSSPGQMRRFGVSSGHNNNNVTPSDAANKELRSIERHLFQLARSLTGGLDIEWERDQIEESGNPLERLRNLGRSLSSNRQTSNNNSISSPHAGLMQCKCNHAMGKLSYPLDPALFHLSGRCKWICCGSDWNDPSPCQADTNNTKSSSSLHSLNYKVLSSSELFNEFIDIPMAIADTNFGSYNFVTNLPAGYVQMPL